MNVLVSIVRELFGLFVDDGWLAVAILAVIALTAIYSALMPNLSIVAGGILLFGCLGILFANVVVASRR